MKTLTCIIAILLLTGCASLSRGDRATLNELRSYGITQTEVQLKHPALAGALNILPGFGNFYLAIGTTESEQWLYGFLNLLTWPISIVWGVPAAVIDANTINKKETVYYYMYDRIGKEELLKRKEAL